VVAFSTQDSGSTLMQKYVCFYQLIDYYKIISFVRQYSLLTLFQCKKQ